MTRGWLDGTSPMREESTKWRKPAFRKRVAATWQREEKECIMTGYARMSMAKLAATTVDSMVGKLTEAIFSFADR